MIKSYDAASDILVFGCCCGSTINKDCSGYQSIDQDVFSLQCQDCGRVTFLNMNIPVGAYDEYDLEQTIFTAEEITARHALRNFIWAKRKDLQLLDRETVDQESYNKHVGGGTNDNE